MKLVSISTILTLTLLISLTTSWCYKGYFNIPGDATNVDISPNNAYMAVTSPTQNSVFIYDLINHNLLLTLATTGVVTSKFSKDGIYLGIGYSNGTVQIISGRPTFNSTSLNTLRISPFKTLTDIDFNPNSSRLLICYSSNRFDICTNYLNATPTCTPIATSLSNDTITKCRFSQNDDVGYIDNNRQVRIYRFAGTWYNLYTSSLPNAFKSFDIRQTTPTPIKFIAAGAGDSKGYYASDTAGSITNMNVLSGGNTLAACYSGDGLFYAFAGTSTDFRVFIYYDNNTQTQIFNHSTTSILSCIFTPDGSYLYTGTVATSSISTIYMYKKNCYQCSPGYYLTLNTTCTPCNSGTGMTFCSACTNATSCISCVLGYYLNQTNAQCFKCDYAMEGCSTCANSTYCYQCNSNYFVNSTNVCQTCISKLTGCLLCNSSTTCQLCSESYYLFNGTCTRCNQTKLNCIRCSNNNTCIQCQFGFYISSGDCLACNNNCTFCYNTATNCTACARGFYTSSFSCTPCSANCLQCNSSNYCFDCDSGTYLTTTGTCATCSFPCVSCNSTSYCYTCATGSYLSSGVCINCALNCTTCLNSTNCSTCSLGYYLTTSFICSSCHSLFSNCATCNVTACHACDLGYYLLANNTCQTCITQGCILCNSSTLCQTCAVGYYLAANFSCALCATNCDSCYISNSNCSSCIPGFYLSGNACTSCANNCQTCNSTICFTCNLGYYLSSGSCTSCNSSLYGCINCYNSSYCNQCQIGKYLTASAACAQCSVGCGACNSTLCFSCNIGYYLASGSCNRCLDNCSQCYSATNCYSCNPGFYYNSSLASSQCVSCWGNFRGCIICNFTACFSCQRGYYLDSTSKTCGFCHSAIPNCQLCQSNTYCEQCSQGYYLNAANSSCLTCISAMSGCQSCSNSSNCSMCSIGYYLNGNSCVACSQRCLTCNSTGCISCSFRYAYLGSDCVSCSSQIAHCEICSNTSTCLRCFEGFYISSGSCVSCQSQLAGCAFCNTSAICTGCLQNYYLFSNACNLCTSIQGCILCSSSTNCSLCTTGYGLSGTACVICSALVPNCVYCSNSTTCTTCSAGYYLNNGACVKCNNALSSCLYCTNSSVCTQCEGGTYLNVSTCSACIVSGCQICSNLSPSQCTNCFSGYYLSSNTCYSCNMTGCLDCSQANTCLSCQLGYYLTSSSSCSPCSTNMSGCIRCSSGNVCKQCQTLYYLSGNSCIPCSGTLVGCAFCTNSTFCLSCNSGYYLNSSGLCSLCTSLSGCLLCSSISNCLYCTSGYYLSGGTCQSCSIIGNCTQCSNSSICTSCLPGYSISNAGGCALAVASSGSSSAAATQTVKNLKWKSFYISPTSLKHILQSVGMKYTKIPNPNWNSNIKIMIGNKKSTSALTLISAEWGRDNEIIFYTNNPLNFTVSPLPSVRLLIGQTLNIDLNTSVEVSQSLLASILPNMLNSNAVTLGYDLNNPQFYITFVNAVYKTNYYIIGISITVLLFLNYLLKAVCTVSHSNNHGNILGHIFAMKTISICLYPTFGEYINYCFGFMTADMPWLNAQFTQLLSDTTDHTPLGYLLYFGNMTLFSTYLLPLIVFLILLSLSYALLKKKQSKKFQLTNSSSMNQQKRNIKLTAVTQLLINFFYFGMVFAGCAALQGSILNPNNIISINGLGYVFGIILYIATLAICLKQLNSDTRFDRFRVFIKGTLLSIAHFNPIYIFAVALATDLILLVIQTKIRYEALVRPKYFVAANLMANCGIAFLFYLPDSIISIYISASMVGLAALIEIYLHYIQKNIRPDDYPVFNKQQAKPKETEINWKINPFDYSLEKEEQGEKLKDNKLVEDIEEIQNNEPDYSTKYSTFKQTTTNKKKDTVTTRRARRFRDTKQSRGATNSSWTSFDFNDK